MIAPELEFFSGHEGVGLAARVWRTEGAVADVIGLHGIVSHSGWYESSGSHLASHSLNVHLLDRRGSGLNLASRGDVAQWRDWIADVVGYVERLPGGRPKILLGISWGGILATSLFREFPDLFSGLALICPGLFSRKAASAGQRAGLRIAQVSGLKNRRVSIPLRDPALFTNSPTWQAFIADDPLTLRKITIGFAINNLALLRDALQSPEQVRGPVLLMLAGIDPITDNGPTRAFVERMPHADNRIVEYAGASHTLEFEDDPAAYFDDLTRWCRRVAGQGESLKGGWVR